MTLSRYEPDRPDITPDLEKPCVKCVHHWRPLWLERVLTGRQHICMSADVLGIEDDPVTGKRVVPNPVECYIARAFGGVCGPKGRHFERRIDR